MVNCANRWPRYPTTALQLSDSALQNLDTKPVALLHVAPHAATPVFPDLWIVRPLAVRPQPELRAVPQISTTNVQRTVGWHLLSIFVETDHVVLAIDNNPVFTAGGNYGYDTVTTFQSGPYWWPDIYSYWDDYVGFVYKAN